MCFFYNCWEQPCADQNAGRWTRQVMKVRSSQYDFSWKKTIWWDRGGSLLFCNTSTNRLTQWLIWTSTIKGVDLNINNQGCLKIGGRKVFNLDKCDVFTIPCHGDPLFKSPHYKHTHIYSMISPVSSKDSKVTITVYCLTLLHRQLQHIWLYHYINIHFLCADHTFSTTTGIPVV